MPIFVAMIDYNILERQRISIGRNITDIRKEKGYSYYRIGKLTGLTIGQIQDIESGGKAYTIDSLIKISKGLGIKITI